MVNIKLESKYSVLMAVYAKENPTFFDGALSSLFGQTLPPNDFVLVCDGPLTEELDAIIEKYDNEHLGIFNIIRLEKNRGLGNALMIGVPECKNELIMRADSDDISLPDRAEKEIKAIIDNNADIVSTNLILFNGSIGNVIGNRNLPEKHDDIIKFAKSRCPFNHPSVMMKKSVVLNAGNYQTLLYKEDYYLWIRMIISGARCYNIQEPLVFMREDGNTIARRKNKAAYQSQKTLLKYMKDQKFITSRQYRKTKFIYWGQYVCPQWLANLVYKKILHKKEAA